MPLARGQHTVLVFKHLQFQGDWTRMVRVPAIGYLANRTGRLLVVVENPTGNVITYWFRLRTEEEVWVT